MTDEAAWSGLGTSLSSAQDHAPIYAEITGYRKEQPKGLSVEPQPSDGEPSDAGHAVSDKPKV